MKKTTKKTGKPAKSKAAQRVKPTVKARPQKKALAPDQLASTYATAIAAKGTAIITEDPQLKGATAILAQAELLTVTTAEQSMEAGRMLVQLKTWRTQVEQKRQFFTRPLKEHVKRVEALFKPVLDKLDEADASIRKKVLEYRTAHEEQARAERAKLLEQAREAQQAGENDAALALATEASSLETLQRSLTLDEGALQVRKVWDFEVEDYAAIPREFFTLDEKKVRAAIRAGQTSIPGLRVFQKEQLAVSTIQQGDLESLLATEPSAVS